MSLASLYDDIRSTLEGYLATNWTGTPIVYPNSRKTIVGQAWIRPTVIYSDAVRVLITGSRDDGEEQIGLLIVQIFVPQGTGTGEAFRYAGEIRDLFKEKRIPFSSGSDSLEMGVPKVEDVGESEEDTWYQVNVECPFEHID